MNTIEKEVLECLVRAWNLFNKLPKQHPDELRDFADGIHKCQYLIGMRIARKVEPRSFPIKD
jgi:hypothetical protein